MNRLIIGVAINHKRFVIALEVPSPSSLWQSAKRKASEIATNLGASMIGLSAMGVA